MAEGARLESVWAGNRLVGSNPTPSANALSSKINFLRKSFVSNRSADRLFMQAGTQTSFALGYADAFCRDSV